MSVKVPRHVYTVNVSITKEITHANARQIINWFQPEMRVSVCILFVFNIVSPKRIY